MVTCDQLGATSNAAKELVNLALDAHGVRAMTLEELETFEQKWVEAVQLSSLQRPDYFRCREQQQQQQQRPYRLSITQ
jgi:hypothetical protein